MSLSAGPASQPIHGNYHGYYSKRPFTDDARLALLPQELFSGTQVLDIGCNEGLVTCQIAQTLGARRVIGVDIDDSLVRAAWKRRRTVWSLQQPAQNPVLEQSNSDLTIRKRKRSSQEDIQRPVAQPDYFPASCEHMFGPLPIPSQSAVSTTFPHNVAFHTADWVSTEIPEDREGYDVVVAFSISKWIHLNGGDQGLLHFFNRVYSVLQPGGTFVLEPQEWDTYAKAKRMSSRLRENAKTLKIRPADFDKILKDIGFCSAEHLGRTGEGGFCRPIELYRKPT